MKNLFISACFVFAVVQSFAAGPVYHGSFVGSASLTNSWNKNSTNDSALYLTYGATFVGVLFPSPGGYFQFLAPDQTNGLTVKGSNFVAQGTFIGNASGLTNNTVQVPTNYVAANFVPIAGQAKFVPSNNWLYVVTQLVTNTVVKLTP